MKSFWDPSAYLGNNSNLFSGSTTSYSNAFTPSKGGGTSKGGSMFDPVSMGVAGAFSLASSFVGADAQSKSAELQGKIARDQIQANERNQASDRLQQRWGATFVPQFNQMLQANALTEQQNIFAPKQRTLESDQFRSAFQDQYSPDALRAKQKENRDRLSMSLAERQNAFNFTPTNPFAYLNPSYAN